MAKVKRPNLQMAAGSEYESIYDLLSKYGLMLIKNVEVERFEVINEMDIVMSWVTFERLEHVPEEHRPKMIKEMCMQAIESLTSH